MSDSDPRYDVEPIAIVGMSGRFPGAPDLSTFWANLEQGVESIEFFSDDELAAAGVDLGLLATPAYVKANGVCADDDQFDARYFGYSPREAQAMDPQQRVFLECAVHALEHAGLDPDSFAGPIGVYAGVGVSTYLKLIEATPGFSDLVGGLQVLIGTNKDHLTTHVSYKLNLRGPSIAVQTACSTSLVAIVQACQALLTYQCDAALAGGVSIAVPQREGYVYEEGGIESPDGHCRPFDAGARGTVGGNGAGVVVLKRLSDARAAGDLVHALIRGFAVNNDGAQKVGYTAPSIQGQAEVIALAQAMAGIAPDTISYIEAHGTGTALGDPIEVAALTQAFRARTARSQFCAIGSVKGNIGHLDSAAGVAGLIKTVLAMRHRAIPRSLHYQSPNPRIDFASSPFFVNAAHVPWDAPFPRRAGVSSFGIGGTNAHVILEEAPPHERPAASTSPQLIVVSGRSPASLARARAGLAAFAESEPGLSVADVSHTLQAGRRTHEHRFATVCRTGSELIAALRGSAERRVHQAAAGRKDPPIAFLFPGQGSQYVGMSRGLYDAVPAYRQVLDQCAEILLAPLGRDLRDLLWSDRTAGASAALDETWVAQPALFSVEYALAQVLIGWGIRPAAMLGHSVGEYTAACLAGVFTLEDALRLVAVRGELVQGLPTGAMLAVPLSAGEVRALATEVEVAAVNAAALTTVSGEHETIDRFADLLRSRGVESKRLHTSHAFHSRALDPVLGRFRREVERVDRRAPRLRYISNVTGTWIDAADAVSPDYYVRQLREPVQFAAGLDALVADGTVLFLEAGPGQALASLARRAAATAVELTALSALGATRNGDEHEAVIDAVGQLWSRGATVDWRSFRAGERRQKVELPGYPFERERFWVESAVESAAETAHDGDESDREEITPGAETAARLYVPSWARGERLGQASAETPDDGAESCWLIFRDGSGLGDRLAAELRQSNRPVVLVDPAPSFEETPIGDYRVRPSEPEDYGRLRERLAARSLRPRRVFHLWGVDQPPAADDFSRAQERGAYSLLAFLQSLTRGGESSPATVVVVTGGAQQVLETDTLRPDLVPILGVCRTVPQEYPAIAMRSVDVERPRDARWPDRVVRRLLSEAASAESGATLAYRAGYRWRQRYDRAEGPSGAAPALRPDGVYLITGGLGRLGLLIAQWIAGETNAHLILTARSPQPPTDEWVVDQLQAIRAAGSTVDTVTVDVADTAAMSEVIEDIRRRHGAVHGVFHCAGATRPEHFAPVAAVTPALWAQHFGPKVYGVLALEHALRDESPDFVLLMSSLSAILGGLGFLPYAAANLFMDAFAQAKATGESTRWISVNWDGWKLEDDDPGDPGRDGGDGLSEEHGLAALERVLTDRPAAQVVVVAGALEPRLRQWIALTGVREGAPAGEAVREPSALHGRPQLTVAYRRPDDEIERQIAQLWQQMLGVAEIGADDNFFELGGHSLLAIQVAARLRERYRIDLGVDTVFNAPTVATLSAEIGRRRTDAAAVDEAALEALVTEIEQMDDSQVRALLADDGDAAAGAGGPR